MVLWSCSNKSWSIDHCDRSQVLIEYDEVAYLQPTINNFLLQRNGISCSMVPLIFYLSKVPIIENFYLLWLFDLLLTVNFCWFISLTVFSAASAESFCRKIQITATCFLTHPTQAFLFEKSANLVLNCALRSQNHHQVEIFIARPAKFTHLIWLSNAIKWKPSCLIWNFGYK